MERDDEKVLVLREMEGRILLKAGQKIRLEIDDSCRDSGEFGMYWAFLSVCYLSRFVEEEIKFYAYSYTQPVEAKLIRRQGLFTLSGQVVEPEGAVRKLKEMRSCFFDDLDPDYDPRWILDETQNIAYELDEGLLKVYDGPLIELFRDTRREQLFYYLLSEAEFEFPVEVKLGAVKELVEICPELQGERWFRETFAEFLKQL